MVLQLTPDRSLARALARVAADPSNPLSPFSEQSHDLREQTVGMLERLCNESEVVCGQELRRHLPKLVWFLYMGLIFFWVHDRSENQRRTESLADLSTTLLDKVLWLSSLPLTGPINRLVGEIVQTLYGAFDDKSLDSAVHP